MADNEEIVIPPITFYADGPTEEIREANLEAVLPSPGFPDAAILIADALVKRADIVVLDYSRDMVAVKYQIDGVWHAMPPRDRASGDYMLASLKKLGNLNYQERRSRQTGEFGASFRNRTSTCRLVTQGVKTGERAAIRIDRPRPPLETLTDVGMRPKMQEKLKEHLAAENGLVMFCSLPGDGLSTTWHAGLSACDRFMRDYFIIEEESNTEPEIINVTSVTYNKEEGELPTHVLRDLVLRQPDVLAVNDLTNAETIEAFCDLANEENKLIISRIHAKSAVESLLRILVHRPPAKKLAQSLRCVVNQRLVRRLCDVCKQPFQPSPAILQKLGIPQGRVNSFYTHFRVPAGEQMLDENGNPVEVEVCQNCEGLGFCEQIAIYEFLEINDEIRELLVKNPDINALTDAAIRNGMIPLRDEGIVLLATGTTSIEELQRVLKK